MTESSDQADSRTAAEDGRTLLPIMTSTSKTAPSVYTFNTEINFKNSPLHHPLWEKAATKILFLSIINCGRSATVEKLDYGVPMKLILGMVSANRKLNQVEKCLSLIVNYSKPARFNYGVRRF